MRVPIEIREGRSSAREVAVAVARFAVFEIVAGGHLLGARLPRSVENKGSGV